MPIKCFSKRKQNKQFYLNGFVICAFVDVIKYHVIMVVIATNAIISSSFHKLAVDVTSVVTSNLKKKAFFLTFVNLTSKTRW
jgi:hypothetical protein